MASLDTKIKNVRKIKEDVHKFINSYHDAQESKMDKLLSSSFNLHARIIYVIPIIVMIVIHVNVP